MSKARQQLTMIHEISTPISCMHTVVLDIPALPHKKRLHTVAEIKDFFCSRDRHLHKKIEQRQGEALRTSK